MNLPRRCSISFGLSAFVAFVGGCDDGSVAFNYNHYDRRPVVEQRVVYVQPTHVCTSACHDHLYDNGHVIVVSGHRHGPGCGHDWDGGHWVVVGKARAVHVEREPVHVARVETTPSAAVRVYSPKRHIWIDIEAGHHHGPHCGHVHRDGRWCVVD